MSLNMNEIKQSFIAQLLISYSFLMAGLIVNLLQLIAFLLIRPVNRLFYRKIDYYLSYLFYSCK
jgi:hypothetical protein